jgi:DNA-binding MarR family transcriptional regulator
VGRVTRRTANWLDPEEHAAWRRFQEMQAKLNAALGRDLAEDSGLSIPDYAVLVILSEQPDGRMRAFELGRELGWEKSRLSHHISRMTARGYIAREKCKSDQRGTFVKVTSLGRKAIEAAAPGHVDAVRRRFVDVLTRDELGTLRSIGEKILERLEKECSEAAAECEVSQAPSET